MTQHDSQPAATASKIEREADKYAVQIAEYRQQMLSMAFVFLLALVLVVCASVITLLRPEHSERVWTVVATVLPTMAITWYRSRK